MDRPATATPLLHRPDTLNNTDEQRYPWTMSSDETPDPFIRDEALSDLIALAERIVDALTLAAPDWCQIARDARQVSRQAEAKCGCTSNDLTRE